MTEDNTLRITMRIRCSLESEEGMQEKVTQGCTRVYRTADWPKTPTADLNTMTGLWICNLLLLDEKMDIQAIIGHPRQVQPVDR
jgi:hypothetical protein